MMYVLFFFFNDTATTEIYTLSLHDALPILAGEENPRFAQRLDQSTVSRVTDLLRRTHDVICVDTGNNVESINWQTDRKSTRLNSSHANISYAVFCLKKKKAL